MMTKLALRLLERYPTPQYMVAAGIGVPPHYITDWKQTGEMPLRRAQQLAEFFDCSVDDVLGWADEHSA